MEASAPTASERHPDEQTSGAADQQGDEGRDAGVVVGCLKQGREHGGLRKAVSSLVIFP